MKKFFLSFFFIVTFAVYSIAEQNRSPMPPVLVQNKSLDSSQAVVPVVPDQAPAVIRAAKVIFSDDEEEGVRIPTPKTAPAKKVATPTPASTPATKTTGGMMNGNMGMGMGMMGAYKNGEYLGSVADAYYGNVQVKAIIRGGKIADVQFLDHPSDRSTSIEINNYAMPILTSEAIQAQSAQVDIVSGASDTSAAFKESLTVALAKAKNS